MASVALGSGRRAVSRRPITGAKIEYTKLPRGEIVVEARLSEPVGAIRERLEVEGVARFEVKATMRDGAGDEVARMSAGWRLSRRSSGS